MPIFYPIGDFLNNGFKHLSWNALSHMTWVGIDLVALPDR